LRAYRRRADHDLPDVVLDIVSANGAQFVTRDDLGTVEGLTVDAAMRAGSPVPSSVDCMTNVAAIAQPVSSWSAGRRRVEHLAGAGIPRDTLA
jgi:hypothetical protein